MPLEPLVAKALPYAASRWTPLLPCFGVAASQGPSGIEASVYNPLVCLILQGAKHTTIGSRTVRVAAGELIVVSHHLPATAQILDASPERPFLSLVFTLDLAELADLHQQVAADLPPITKSSSYEVSAVEPTLLDVFRRTLDLVHTPVDAQILLPLLRRELHLRLLRSESSGMVRRLLSGTSHADHVAQAIQILRAHYRDRLEVDALARSVGMSPSSFYRHFKAITETTPLQYQKDLRLTEARRLLASGDHSVSSAAFEVGYESPSQFSREYSRRFGASPRAHLGA